MKTIIFDNRTEFFEILMDSWIAGGFMGPTKAFLWGSKMDILDKID